MTLPAPRHGPRPAAPPAPRRLVLLGSLLLSLACDPVTLRPPAAPAPRVRMITVEKGATWVPGVPAKVLPAYETAAERAASPKNDAATDYRNKHRQWFAQTVPPSAVGSFRPFAEWETMKAVWTTYSNGMPGTPSVRRMIARQTIDFIRHSKPRVRAYVIVSGKTAGEDFLKAVEHYGITGEEKKSLTLVTMPNQTIWHIDYGPFPIVNKADDTLAFTDFIYYPGRYVDDAVPTRIGREVYEEVTTFKMPLPFEGGNIQSDGHSTCMTSTRELANTGYSALKIRSLLKKYLGCETTLIVKDISDDGTGHIDMFFKWLSPDHVIFGKYYDSITLDYDGDGKAETLPMPGAVNPDYVKTFKLNQKRMEDNVKLVAAYSSPVTGKKIRVSRLTMMTAYRDSYGFLPRTFINSTFANGVNVYPTYSTRSCRDPAGTTCMKDADCPARAYCSAGRCTVFGKNGNKLTLGTPRGCDELEGCPTGLECALDPLKVALAAKAQKQWEEAMPGYQHVGLRADRIALWSGAIHCITRTIPDKPFRKVVLDGLCLAGTCGCAKQGYDGPCTGNEDCVGAERMCGCPICKGTCKGSGKSCTDDADCSSDVKTVPAGSCLVDAGQACAGEPKGCGSLGWEGTCDGSELKYCSNGKAKQLSCPGCCGWDAKQGSYGCLDPEFCARSCVPECDKAGVVGCSLQGSHAWRCAEVGGCLERQWLWCEGGTTCVDGKCIQPGGGRPECPGHHGEDAGGTDAANSGMDAGPALDVGSGERSDATTTTPKPPARDEGGCSSSGPEGGSASPVAPLALLLAALAGLLGRRRRSSGRRP